MLHSQPRLSNWRLFVEVTTPIEYYRATFNLRDASIYAMNEAERNRYPDKPSSGQFRPSRYMPAWATPKVAKRATAILNKDS